ncbi:poly(A) binding protein Nab2 [Schizosaccharomyces japonicus yFS275]|uniref:Poly(A) binding protein Nab2 n=1 Tax=Schizosaccharomyces japonicus (strain yFS275 / FY16936) TaxID=402676 RepID=B6K495_SCHJY|nr:poly(A) binding protein Nab2 [Schizosaccharomyces japonicus yFS275]EEB08302.2 poly(A) binding protein Nab2 [Schizosaccharomyces japonicus yFS275]
MSSFLGNSEMSSKLHDAIEKKLTELNWSDEAASLADFIIVMVTNGKNQQQIHEELVDLVGSELDASFSKWLFEKIDELEKPQTAQTRPNVNETKETKIKEASPKKSEQEITGSDSTPELKSAFPSVVRTERVGQKLKTTTQKRFNPLASSFKTHAQVAPSTKRFFQSDIQLPLCKYAEKCGRPDCIFAHPSPASKDGMVLSSKQCSAGRECDNPECVDSHPSPANHAVTSYEFWKHPSALQIQSLSQSLLPLPSPLQK